MGIAGAGNLPACCVAVTGGDGAGCSPGVPAGVVPGGPPHGHPGRAHRHEGGRGGPAQDAGEASGTQLCTTGAGPHLL